MTFTDGNLFPSHSYIGWTESSPTRIWTLFPRLKEADDLPTELSLPPGECEANVIQQLILSAHKMPHTLKAL